MKKEPGWLTNSDSGNGNGSAHGTPVKTPRKKKSAASANGGAMEGDDEEDFSPSKKSIKKDSLNKVQGGRVSKAGPRTPKKEPSFGNGAMDIEGHQSFKTEDNGHGYQDEHDHSIGFYDAHTGYNSDDQV
jgi:hypothetical protein